MLVAHHLDPSKMSNVDLTLLKRRALANNPTAQFGLSVRYRQGVGTPQDLARAHIWRLQAARRGHRRAMWMLVMAYTGTMGIEKDERKARYWSHRLVTHAKEAADKGDRAAAQFLAELKRLGPRLAAISAQASQLSR